MKFKTFSEFVQSTSPEGKAEFTSELLEQIGENTETLEISMETPKALRELATAEFNKNGESALYREYMSRLMETGEEVEPEMGEKITFEIEDRLNVNKEISFGSSCAQFCQSTRTNSSLGNYTRKGK